MTDLFRVADAEGIEIIYGNFPATISMSMPNYVGLDYSLLWMPAAERVCCAHELGHCIRGAFYNRYAPHDLRARYEVKADKWAIKKLVPRDELEQAIKDGREPWELAELFGVTEEFMQKAMHWYFRGNLTAN